MKLSNIIQIHNCYIGINALNQVLHGKLEYAIDHDLKPMKNIIGEMTEKATKKLSEGGKKPSQDQISGEVNRIARELSDLDIPLDFIQIDPDWLPEKVPSGASQMLAPILTKKDEAPNGLLEKALKAKQKAEEPKESVEKTGKPKKQEKA